MPITAATFPLPAAGCRIAPRCAPITEPVFCPTNSRDRGSMKQQLVLSCLGFALLTALPVSNARADEMPLRKPGLWEMKIVKTGSVLPEMTMQHCTDETTEKQMSTAFSPVAKEACSKRDIAKTATGYVSDSVCSVGGVTMTSHSEVTGDFNSGYTVRSTAH